MVLDSEKQYAVNTCNYLTRKIPEIWVNSISINIQVIWCDILPDCYNHTRAIRQLEHRLNQPLQ